MILALPVLANENPIEITADQELEWDRANLNFTARGNALVKQGDSSILAPTITAHYADTDQGVLIQSVVAAPNAVLKQINETISANNVTAVFHLGVLNNVSAKGDVVVKTKKGEILYGDIGDYNASSRIVTMTGDVRIEQGKNILTGNRAEFDLNTNISTMTADSNTNNGRVKAIFYGGEGK